MALPKILDLITIRNRKEIEENGISLLNFSDQVIEFRKALTYSTPPIKVTEELAGKPWIISKIHYGDESYLDLLLFFNGISNPLSIERGMELKIPDLDSMLANVRDVTVEDEDVNESKDDFNKKLPKKDKDRIAKLISQERGVPEDEVDIRPPNIVSTGSRPVIPQDGRVILGTNVSERNEDDLTNTQKLSERVRDAVKKKIENMSNGDGVGESVSLTPQEQSRENTSRDTEQSNGLGNNIIDFGDLSNE